MADTKMAALTVAAAVAGAVSMAALAMPGDALAAGKEKCYGIAKAGENDCANAAGTHSCAAQSTVDFHGGDWKAVASGSCQEMGGQLAAFEGVNENVSS